MVQSKRLKSIFNPEMYHGWGKTNNYFEGWYFKQVDSNGSSPLAIIPGIAYEASGESHSFIQVLDGRNNTSHYHRFDTKDFDIHPERFSLNILGNHFSPERLRLDLPDIKGEIRFSRKVPWPNKWYSPGVMGWYTFVPFMQCYHGVVSMDHDLEGNLSWKGENVSFNKGKGYIEKDWGRSFPSSWFWMQSNSFQQEYPVSLMASVAKIPWATSSFVGFLAGFLLDDQLFRFTTYTGAKLIHKKLEAHHLELTFKQKKYTLEIKAHKASTEPLVAPTNVGMTGKVDESMSAKLEVQFKEGKQVLFEGTGLGSGLEIGGNYPELL